jgi:spore coat protein U-like protein
MRKNTLTLALGLAAGLLAAPLFAGTATGNLTVQATVVAGCSLNTGGANAGNALLNFGNVSSTLANIDADTTSTGNNGLSIICTNTTPYSVTANNGLNATGTQDRMVGAAGVFLPYNLYTTAGRTIAFPNSGTSLGGVGNGLAQTIPVYGRIPAGTTLPAPGSYLDTVVLTVTY